MPFQAWLSAEHKSTGSLRALKRIPNLAPSSAAPPLARGIPDECGENPPLPTLEGSGTNVVCVCNNGAGEHHSHQPEMKGIRFLVEVHIRPRSYELAFS